MRLRRGVSSVASFFERLNLFPKPMIADSFRALEDDYVLKEKIGYGRYGDVRKGISKTTKQIVAIKSLDKHQLQSSIADVTNEIAILKQLDHPHVMKLLDVIEDVRQVHIVSNLCVGGELFDRIIQAGSFSEKDAALYLREILLAVEYCHTVGVTHRDLKPENLMFYDKDTSHLCLCDFGMASSFEPGNYLNDCCGSPTYVAPEVLKRQYNEKCDIWSAGVLLYIFLCGKIPFSGSSDEEIMKNVSEATEMALDGEEWNVVSDSAKSLLKLLLNPNPELRISATDALNHRWIKELGEDNDHPLGFAMENFHRFTAHERIKKTALYTIAKHLSHQKKNSIVLQLKNLFKSLDQNNSGFVDVNLLVQAIMEDSHKLNSFNVRCSTDELADVIRSADLDSNGTIDMSEFLAAALPHETFVSNDNVLLAFKFFDKKEKGYVTLEDLYGAFSEESPDIVKSIFVRYDLNNDGKISFEEFMYFIKQD